MTVTPQDRESAREWLGNAEGRDWTEDDAASLAELLAAVRDEQRELDAMMAEMACSNYSLARIEGRPNQCCCNAMRAAKAIRAGVGGGTDPEKG